MGSSKELCYRGYGEIIVDKNTSFWYLKKVDKQNYFINIQIFSVNSEQKCEPQARKKNSLKKHDLKFGFSSYRHVSKQVVLIPNMACEFDYKF